VSATKAADGSAKRFYWILGGLAAVAAAALGYTVLRGKAAPPAPEPVPLEEAQATLAGGHELGMAKGDPNAPLVVQEFADYQCPACAQFSALTARALHERYVNTGRVYWIFFDFPIPQIHPNAVPAAEAARCAGDQGNYWGMHDILFARQPEWAKEGNPLGRFVEYARALGLDGEALRRCVQAGTHRQTVLQSRERGLRLGVDATPTFFIGSQRTAGAVPFDEFARILDRELAARSAGGGGR
jgi:protein-disulfide isomerase